MAGGRTGAERLERAAGAALKTIWETGAAADATGPVSEDRRKFFFTLTSAVASGVLTVTYAAPLPLPGPLLVVRAAVTRRLDAERSQDLLRALETPVLGLVINGINPGQGGYGYGYGYHYGYGTYGRARLIGKRRRSGPRTTLRPRERSGRSAQDQAQRHER